MDQFFSLPYYETWLKEASPEIKDWFKKEISYLKKNIKPNSKILDIGCGFGRHIEILAPFSNEIIGIDNNKSMIEKAKQKLANLKNVRLFLQDAKKLSFPKDYFDYVICMTNTFGDFPDIKIDVLKEMKRVCKKDGKIIISVYSQNAFKIRLDDYKRVGLHISKIKEGIIYTEEGLISEEFTKSKLEELFRVVGLISKISELSNISYICELSK